MSPSGPCRFLVRLAANPMELSIDRIFRFRQPASFWAFMRLIKSLPSAIVIRISERFVGPSYGSGSRFDKRARVLRESNRPTRSIIYATVWRFLAQLAAISAAAENERLRTTVRTGVQFDFQPVADFMPVLCQ